MNRKQTDHEPAMRADAPDLLVQPPATDTGGLHELLKARPNRHSQTHTPLPDVVIGELVALADQGQTPLVRYPGQPGSAALHARAVLDLHGAHVGGSVVLSFENGDAALPIVMGVLMAPGRHLPTGSGHLQVDVDGDRMIVSAREQLVLQCGEASITLTKAGKVLIRGTYVSSDSSGASRIRGGSVQIN